MIIICYLHLLVSRCCSVFRNHTPAARTHLLQQHPHTHTQQCTTQKHPHTSDCWQWAEIGGVTIPLPILPASVILPPNSLCPHALSPPPPLSISSHPTLQFHLSALSLVLLPLPPSGIVSKRATFSWSGCYRVCQHSQSNASHCQGRVQINYDCP